MQTVPFTHRVGQNIALCASLTARNFTFRVSGGGVCGVGWRRGASRGAMGEVFENSTLCSSRTSPSQLRSATPLFPRPFLQPLISTVSLADQRRIKSDRYCTGPESRPRFQVKLPDASACRKSHEVLCLAGRQLQP